MREDFFHRNAVTTDEQDGLGIEGLLKRREPGMGHGRTTALHFDCGNGPPPADYKIHFVIPLMPGALLSPDSQRNNEAQVRARIWGLVVYSAR